MHPIAQQLIKGNQFSFRFLRAEVDALEEFWEEWWNLNRDSPDIVRPYPLSDDDPMLRPTVGLEYADTVTNAASFGEHLGMCISTGKLQKSRNYPRAAFREDLAEAIFQRNAGVQHEQPVAFFLGGGYGSGKSSGIATMLKNGLPTQLMGLNCLCGVDICKPGIPEYNCLTSIFDGRASATTQAESRIISDLVFTKLVDGRCSFGWDSSLSNFDAAMEKMERCRAAGYKVVLLGTLTDMEVAKRRAMKRAYQIYRFPPPDHFESSHAGFRKHLPQYLDFVDGALVLDNSVENGDPIPVHRKGMEAFGFE